MNPLKSQIAVIAALLLPCVAFAESPVWYVSTFSKKVAFSA